MCIIYFVLSAKLTANKHIYCGEVSEWFKEPVLKTGDSARGRGFESHPLRHFFAQERH